jgi:Protein of unknown function (DUF4240)
VTEFQFWKLIASIDVNALDNGCEDDAIEPLQAALELKSDQELFAFEEILSQKLYDIDGEAYADNAEEGGSSDDAFLYARCYVVAKGAEFYEMVKADPTRMPKTIEQWCEPLLYPHRTVWAARNGTDESAWPFEATVSYETASNEALWDL